MGEYSAPIIKSPFILSHPQGALPCFSRARELEPERRIFGESVEDCLRALRRQRGFLRRSGAGLGG